MKRLITTLLLLPLLLHYSMADSPEATETKRRFIIQGGVVPYVHDNNDGQKIYEITPNFEVAYRAVDNLEIGLYFSTFTTYEDMSHTTLVDIFQSETYTYDVKQHFTNFGLFFRYNWLNTEYLTLYSSAGTGFSYVDQTLIAGNPRPGDVGDRLHTMLDLTPIGLRVGGQIYGYFEPISFGTRKFQFNIGIGIKL